MLRKALCSLIILSIMSSPVFAQDDRQQKSERQQKQQQNERKQQQSQQRQQKSRPYQKANNSWITLNGTVVSSKADSFVLDYGEGVITVEMDDWDWYREGNLLSDGDKVSVTGRIDADSLERRTIEASSVFVDDLNTYYFASASDEELDPYFVSTTYYLQPLDDESYLSLTGTVSQVSGREFTLDTGVDQIKVDTSTMAYNPLDKQGFQQISRGDQVSVSGELDLDFFEAREILADSIITLSRDSGKSKAEQQQSSG